MEIGAYKRNCNEKYRLYRCIFTGVSLKHDTNQGITKHIEQKQNAI